MALPASGSISLSQVNTELGIASTTAISMNQTNVRSLFGVASGVISMSNGYGKSSFTAITGQYNGQYQSGSATSSYSFGSVNFGTVSASRRVVIAAGWNGGTTNVLLSSATIGVLRLQ